MKKFFGFLFFVLFVGESIIGTYFVKFEIPKKYLMKVSNLVSFNDKILFFMMFILPYIIFFLIWMLPFLVSKKDSKEFLITSFTFFFTATIVLAFYLLFQTSVLAPRIPPHTFFDKVVLFIYSLNRPSSLFPVQYIIFTILSNLVLFKLNTKIGYYLLPITLLVTYFFFTVGEITLLSFLVSLMISLLGFFIFLLFS